MMSDAERRTMELQAAAKENAPPTTTDGKTTVDPNSVVVPDYVDDVHDAHKNVTAAYQELYGRDPTEAEMNAGLGTAANISYTDLLRVWSAEGSRKKDGKGIDPTKYGNAVVDPTTLAGKDKEFYDQWKTVNKGPLYSADLEVIGWHQDAYNDNAAVYGEDIRGKLYDVRSQKNEETGEISTYRVLRTDTLEKLGYKPGDALPFSGSSRGNAMFIQGPDAMTWAGGLNDNWQGKAFKNDQGEVMGYGTGSAGNPTSTFSLAETLGLEDELDNWVPNEFKAVTALSSGMFAGPITGRKFYEEGVKDLSDLTGLKEDEVQQAIAIADQIKIIALNFIPGIGTATAAAAQAAAQSYLAASKRSMGYIDSESMWKSIGMAAAQYGVGRALDSAKVMQGFRATGYGDAALDIGVQAGLNMAIYGADAETALKDAGWNYLSGQANKGFGLAGSLAVNAARTQVEDDYSWSRAFSSVALSASQQAFSKKPTLLGAYGEGGMKAGFGAMTEGFGDPFAKGSWYDTEYQQQWQSGYSFGAGTRASGVPVGAPNSSGQYLSQQSGVAPWVSGGDPYAVGYAAGAQQAIPQAANKLGPAATIGEVAARLSGASALSAAAKYAFGGKKE